MMRQYMQAKQENPDALLMFRMGDFFEMFGEDAKVASRELDIVLTSRAPAKGTARVPMCGVPYHAIDSYLARLIRKGYRVAVCEQMEDPAKAKGLVKREVIRVVTPGTVLDTAMLEEKANNWLVAVCREGGRFGVAAVDGSTGDFAATEVGGDGTAGGNAGAGGGVVRPEEALVAELERLSPSEIILPSELYDDAAMRTLLGQRVGAAVHRGSDLAFTQEGGERVLRDQLRVVSLEGFGLEGHALATAAAGAAVDYLRETQRGALLHLGHVSFHGAAQQMVLDATAQRNLELVRSLRDGTTRGTLLGVLDLTRTAMGGRAMRRRMLQPLMDLDAISGRLDQVEALAAGPIPRGELAESLGELHDLERLTSRVSSGYATPRDLGTLRESLGVLPRVRAAAEAVGAPAITGLAEGIGDLGGLRGLLERALVESPPVQTKQGGIVREGYSETLDAIKGEVKGSKEWVRRLQDIERARTGIRSLKVGFNKVFGYYIEVSKPNLSLVPEDYRRKQTIANGERFITDELKRHEQLILSADEKIQALEEELFEDLRRQAASHARELMDAAHAAAALDVACALAEAAVRRRYVRPVVDAGTRLRVRDGRHPVLETLMPEGEFVPNDADLDCDAVQLALITGPNMAGKSTYMRQLALIAIMAQMGSFVPAARAEVGLVDRVFTRVGASDDLARGQSTFMVEMIETASILNCSTDRSLLLLDEIGRGTSTFDGLSIAWAVVEYLHAHSRARTLFATHYHQLTGLDRVLPRLRNFHITAEERGGEVVFLRKVVDGPTDKSYGIQVAALAGLPREVVARAKDILVSIESRDAITVAAQPGGGRARSVQTVLFEPDGTPYSGGRPRPSPLEEEVRGIDLLNLTPLQALAKLGELKERLGGLGDAGDPSDATSVDGAVSKRGGG
jgi:DNA mismatch repair protein MutS